MPSTPPAPRHTYTLQITLLGVTPPVWRLVAAPGDLTLARLHQVIQQAMGWSDAHPYHFEASGQTYPDPAAVDRPAAALDPRRIVLDDLQLAQGSTVTYIYDLGDDWVHQLTVEGVAPPSAALRSAVLLGGAGACPPEKSGGPGGYAALLAAQDAIDPDAWDPVAAALRLSGLAKPSQAEAPPIPPPPPAAPPPPPPPAAEAQLPEPPPREPSPQQPAERGTRKKRGRGRRGGD
jgi:hypothetical protein